MLLIKRIRRFVLYIILINILSCSSSTNLPGLQKKCFYIKYLNGNIGYEKLYVPSKSFMYMEENNLYYKVDCSYIILGEYCYHSEAVLKNIQSFAIVRCGDWDTSS